MPTYHINRSNNLKNILDDHGWHPAGSSEIADFGMWCESGVGSRIAKCELFNGQITRLIDDKLCMFELLSEFNQQDLTLKVYSHLTDYLEYLKSTNSPVFCFLKTTLGAGGTGVYVFNNLKDLIYKLMEDNHNQGQMIIQQGIQDVPLINGRKFKIRSYVLITKNWQTYVYKDSLLVLHDEIYSPDSTSAAVQLSPNSGTTAKLLADEPGLSGLDEQIQQIAYLTIKCLKLKSANMENSGSYHLFGYDFICDANYQAYLVETNGFPNIERADQVGNSLSKQMMSDLKKLIIDPITSDLTPVAGGFIRVC